MKNKTQHKTEQNLHRLLAIFFKKFLMSSFLSLSVDNQSPARRELVSNLPQRDPWLLQGERHSLWCLTEEHPLQTRNQCAPQRIRQKVFLQISTSMFLKPLFLFSPLSEYLLQSGAHACTRAHTHMHIYAHTHIHQTKIKTKTKQETQTTYRKA